MVLPMVQMLLKLFALPPMHDKHIFRFRKKKKKIINVQLLTTLAVDTVRFIPLFAASAAAPGRCAVAAADVVVVVVVVVFVVVAVVVVGFVATAAAAAAGVVISP